MNLKTKKKKIRKEKEVYHFLQIWPFLRSPHLEQICAFRLGFGSRGWLKLEEDDVISVEITGEDTIGVAVDEEEGVTIEIVGGGIEAGVDKGVSCSIGDISVAIWSCPEKLNVGFPFDCRVKEITSFCTKSLNMDSRPSIVTARLLVFQVGCCFDYLKTAVYNLKEIKNYC